jgi:serine/threonine-protein kinase
MEFVEGETLRRRLGRDRALPEPEAVGIVLAAAEGIAAAHERGIVHRDIKPENILLATNGRVCVTDLGLAKAVSRGRSKGSALTASGKMLGTAAYVPPEQFSSAKHVGPAADVWSLGVIMVEMLTGALPWQAKATNAPALMREITAHSLPDFERILGGGSRALGRIAAGALRRDPKDRYADCGQMARALRSGFAVGPR